MESGTANPQQLYTILRIKRKRGEEPLDALVVDHRKKRKGQGGVNVFQYAETVEDTAWVDEKLKHDLESRISTLARESTKKRPHSESPVAEEPPKTHLNVAASPLRSTSAEERRYKIVSSKSREAARPTQYRRPTAPPKIHSVKELQKALFTVYDAVPSSASRSTGPAKPTDPEIENFLPMLQDYLKINAIDTSIAAPKADEPEVDDNDYVWDVFYSRPVDELELSKLSQNVGTVTGLPEDGLYASDSDSEEEDEDDEDSNAEDWYKNDYPDEESSDDESESSDAFHEASDGEGELYEDTYNRIIGNNSWRH